VIFWLKPCHLKLSVVHPHWLRQALRKRRATMVAGTAAFRGIAGLFTLGTAGAGKIDINWEAKVYEPITISTADEVVFNYTEAHDVWLFENQASYDQCDFAQASQYGGRSHGSYTFSSPTPGTYHFACAMGTHCSSMGQKITITVQEGDSRAQMYSQYGKVMAGPRPSMKDYFNDGERMFTEVYEVKATIPAEETYYSYIGWNFPQDKDYHIVGFEAITNTSEFLHHYVLNSCRSKGSYSLPVTNTVQDKFSYEDECFSQIWGWALGADWFMAPKNAGFFMGKSDLAGKAMELQMHYDNPLFKSGMEDVSHLIVYYTDTIREHHLGTLTIGSGGRTGIEPIQPGLSSHYNSMGIQCHLQQDITIVGHISHAHLLGRSISTEKWKKPSGGKMAEVIDSDYGYDPVFFFDNQNYISWSTQKNISNGDFFVITCLFDSSGRSAVTNGGPGTRDEMCINFLLYYPATGTEHCEIQHATSGEMPGNATKLPPSMFDILSAQGGTWLESSMHEACAVCPKNDLIPDVIAVDEGDMKFTCQQGQDFLSQGGAEAFGGCSAVQALFSKCCESTKQPTCDICASQELQNDVVAGQDENGDYTCGEAQLYVDSSGTSALGGCDEAQKMWKHCCKEKAPVQTSTSEDPQNPGSSLAAQVHYAVAAFAFPAFVAIGTV